MIKFDPQTEGYTDEEKIIWDRWITNNDSLSMYTYSQVALATKFADLYHSFERGRKGYYQQIIDMLVRQGEEEFNKYLVLYQECADIENEVSEMVFTLIESRAT